MMGDLKSANNARFINPLTTNSFRKVELHVISDLNSRQPSQPIRLSERVQMVL